MSHHAGNAAGLQLSHLHAIATGRDAVDGVDDNRPCRNVQRQGRVAEQLILQHVHAGIETLCNHLVLSQHLCLAERNRLAIGVDGEHMPHEGHIHHLVLRDKHRARRAIEGDSTAFVVQNGRLADGCRGTIVGHDVARSRDPQRQILIRELLEVGQTQHILVRHLVGTSVAGIVHDECALLLVLLHELRHLGIAITRRRRLARVGIPHHFLDEIAGVALVGLDGSIVDVAHVGIAIAVVAHEHEGVLPGAGILVFGIADDLVHHHLCIAFRRHGEATHGHIGQSGRSLIGIAAGGKGFAVVEHAEELIADVAVGLAERVVALEAE